VFGDAVITTDATGTVTFLNPAARQLSGLGGEDGLGRPIETLIPGAGEYLKLLGGGSGFVLVVRDLTGAVIGGDTRAQEQLLRSQKLESLSVLAGGIAHEFNNLLMGIIANASLILDEVPMDSAMAGLCDNILAATEEASHLTRQMLAYSGRGQFSVEPLSLSNQIEGISSLIKASIPKGVRLCLNLEPDLPRIDADAGQIQQLVMNLVMNSAEAIGSDGVLTISAFKRDLEEKDQPANLSGAPLPGGAYVALEVADTGSGMDEATRAKMFDPFFTTRFTGRGLGLAAVLGIVRGHRGGIAVSSEPGSGTTFRVFFPVQKQTTSAPQAEIGALAKM
jgi:signal transduction histidine kinase